MAQYTNRGKCRRFRKGALRIILKDPYKTYKHALAKLVLEKLSEWREKLCLIFAQKCTKKNCIYVFHEKEETLDAN